jgi:hypothetical protein
LGNGDPLLSLYSIGKGKRFVLTVALDDAWSNFHRHALFVPALFNIAINSTNSGTSSETIGSNDLIPVDSKLKELEVLKMQRIGETESFVPERVARADGNGIQVHDQVIRDGHYLLRSSAGDTLQTVSFNYHRAESELQFLSAEELIITANTLGYDNIQILDGSTESLSNQVQELHNGKQLWRLFLILALACLLIETILIRIL